MIRLPIDDVLPRIIQAVRADVPVVLKAPPGAGKTTGVPPALLDPEIGGEGQLVLIQPRRMAARAAASRLAGILNSPLGGRIGYHVRFDKRCTRSTRLVAMTTGILLRRLAEDPLLEDVSCVLLDEFHERSLEADLALGMLHRIRTTLRPELKLVVMSATLDPQPIVDFLGDAAAVDSEGRSFPVDVHYALTDSQQPIEQQVAEVLPQALQQTSGDVLVFLPGVGEIRRTANRLQSLDRSGEVEVAELYGDLSPEKQDAILKPARHRRVILSTNVAETSITIDGVTAVIDSGQVRMLRFDPGVGLPKLQLEPISQASADQRAGRAGRTEPGQCYRLWSEAMHRARRLRETPEIERSDFSGALLLLTAWGERDVPAFPWLTPPSQQAVDAAHQLLVGLDAVDHDRRLSETGERMLQLPLHPRLARFLVEAQRWGVADKAAVAAAMLSARDPFRGVNSSDSSVTPQSFESDVVDRVEQFERWSQGDKSIEIPGAIGKSIKQTAKQISRSIDGRSVNDAPTTESDNRQGLQRALLAAYPDRIAQRRQSGSPRGRMVGGRGIKLAAGSSVRQSEYFLCIDVDDRGPETFVRIASAIELDWIDNARIREITEYEFDADRETVVGRRRRYLDDLILSAAPVACRPGPQVSSILFAHARRVVASVLPAEDSASRQLIVKVRFLNEHCPELELPPLDDAAIEAVLKQLCQNAVGFKDLRTAPWSDFLKGNYTYEQLQIVDRLAPDRMTLPSGNTAAIQYEAGDKPPTLKVRIQEIFGWADTPRVASGRVPIRLQLLGPNYRTQQITDDLANFWATTYSQVRKDLRGRYPKHHWPADPTTASATRNGLKPR